jgi:hypothetical protein
MKTANYNTLTALVGAAVILFAGMPQANADPQAEAAALFQHPLTWISSTDRVQQSGQGSDKVIDAQIQAQRILQSFNDVRVESVGSGSKSVEPQLQAARLLNHKFQCNSYC